MSTKRNEGINVGKIIAITLAIVAGACAVIWFALKLYRKYCLLDCGECDEELDALYDEMYDEEGGCEVVLDEAEEAPAAEQA